MKIRIAKDDDRVTVAAILFRNGYMVRPVKVKEGGKTVVYVEVIPLENEVV